MNSDFRAHPNVDTKIDIQTFVVESDGRTFVTVDLDDSLSIYIDDAATADRIAEAFVTAAAKLRAAPPPKIQPEKTDEVLP